MRYEQIFKTCGCYGKHIMNFYFDQHVIFYDDFELKYCRTEFTSMWYFRFDASDEISFLSDSRNCNTTTLCKIRRTKNRNGI